MKTHYDYNLISSRIGFYSSIFMTVITLITLGFAITAVPISGAFCQEGCIDYPYLNTLKQFPKDFIWMHLAILLVLTFVVFVVSIHFYASKQKKVFSQLGLTFAIISAVILTGDYFIQCSVIPASLMNGETEGIPMLIQYNPHGLFVALEELGYIMMSFSFLFLAPVFTNNSRIEKAIRWIFIIAFVLTILSFAIVSFKYGIVRQDRFEVAVILIDWLVLITNGVLISIVFKRAEKQMINQ